MNHLFLYEDFKTKKTILYLHGLGSSPNQHRIGIMKLVANVLSPLLHYEEKPSWNVLVEIMETNKPDAIVGSSLGGYLAFHLSNKFQVPALLFNPAMGTTVSDGTNIRKMQPVEENPLYKNKMAVVGLKDVVVDPAVQLEALRGIKRIKKDKDMGHTVPDNKFEEYFSEFYRGFLL
jgi:hypothetical protein